MPTAEFRVERKTVEPGRSFSKESMERLGLEILGFIAASVMERWNRTGEPPTAVKVRVEVEAQ